MTLTEQRLAPPRSLFFVPGHRPDMIAKVPRWQPDVAVVDLEDAVPEAQKETARRLATQAVTELGDLPGTTVLVRVNPPTSPWFTADVVAAAGCAAGVVLPKVEDPAQLGLLRRLLAEAGSEHAIVVAGLETARGVADARMLLSSGVDAGYFGAEDLVTDLGGRRTAAGLEVLYARSAVRLAARLAGVPAIDQAVVAIRDDTRFVADAEEGRAMGYSGKICVHPRQVELAHQVFSPSAEELAHARAVVEASSSGVAVVDGLMVDDVHVRLARAMLARAGEPEPRVG